MLSRNLEQTLHRALILAGDRHHEYATLEHLLLALVDDADAVTVFRACGVDLERLPVLLAGGEHVPLPLQGQGQVDVAEDAVGVRPDCRREM